MRDLSQAEIEALLRHCKVGRIGIYDQHHRRTYVVPVSFQYRDGAAYLHSAPGLKLDLLHEQPAGVCFEVDDIADEGEWRNQVLRYRATGDILSFDRYVIRSGMGAASIHDGCRLRFGADGKLWVTMGENGNGKLAQDPNVLNGKVLRVETDGGR